MHSISFRFEEISKILRSLDVNKAHGRDDIFIEWQRFVEIHWLDSVSLLFKKSFDNSYFPELWKKSNIIPVHKTITNRILKLLAPFHCFLFLITYLKKLYLIKCTFSSKRTTLKSKSIWFLRIRFVYKSVTLNHTRNFPVFWRYSVTQS